MARTPAPSRRAAPTKVSKPFPWAAGLGSLALGTALTGLLVYAALNQGSGVRDIVRNPDAAIEGVAVAAPDTLKQGHVQGAVKYPQTPPNSGDHNSAPQQCAVYTAPIAPEHALHSLEHGAIWVTYNDSVPEDQVAELAAKVQADPYGLMSPVPEQKSPINLSAWGRRLSVDTAGDPRIDDFIEGYASGPQAPERGAVCAGNSTTGPVAPAGAPAPQVSTAIQLPVTPPSGAATAPSAAASPAG